MTKEYKPWYWVNDVSKNFFKEGYVPKGKTYKEHLLSICKKSEKILGKEKDNFAERFYENISKGWYLLPTPNWTSFDTENESGISCFSSYCGDSVSDILLTGAEVGKMSQIGGGTSIYLGDVRPRGSDIKSGGKSSGAVSFIPFFEEITNVISQKSRRGYVNVSLPIEHDDLDEFLMIRTDGYPVQNVAYTVTITDEFMKKVEDGDNSSIKKLAKVIANRFNQGFPFISFVDTQNENTVDVYKDKGMKILGNNLCFTGDTIVAVADGRNGVSIKRLAEESNGKGKFKVYSGRKKQTRGKGWVAEIKNAVAFQTGEQKVIEVVLSNGTSFKCTPDHELALNDNTWVKAKDSLGVELVKFFSSQQLSGVSKHRHINTFTNAHAKQYRLMWEFANGKKPKGYHIDHIVSGSSDSLENLQLLTSEEHFVKNGLERMGSSNARHKIVNKEVYNSNISNRNFLNGNPNSNGLTNLELIEIGVECEKMGMVVNNKNCKKINPNFPINFSKNRFGGSLTNFKLIVSGEIDHVENENVDKLVYEKEVKYGIDFADKITVIGINYLDEVVPVYDLTVEDNHNFYILTKGDENYENSEGVLVHNCQEVALPITKDESFVCNILAMNALHYDEWKDTDAIELAIYFMDSVMTDFIDKMKNVRLMERAVKFAENHRALGLGCSNYHYLLLSKGLPFESEGARELNIELFRTIQEQAWSASEKMAIEYGKPAVLKEDKYKRRHTTLTAVAPNTSSQSIVGLGSCSIEPLMNNFYVRKLAKDKVEVKNIYLQQLLEEKGQNTSEIWTNILINYGSVSGLTFLSDEEKKLFKTFKEIDQFEILKQASDRQVYIDQSQSLNLALATETTDGDSFELIFKAHKLKIKSLYYQLNFSAAMEFNQKIECESCAG